MQWEIRRGYCYWQEIREESYQLQNAFCLAFKLFYCKVIELKFLCKCKHCVSLSEKREAYCTNQQSDFEMYLWTVPNMCKAKKISMFIICAFSSVQCIVYMLSVPLHQYCIFRWSCIYVLYVSLKIILGMDLAFKALCLYVIRLVSFWVESWTFIC